MGPTQNGDGRGRNARKQALSEQMKHIDLAPNIDQCIELICRSFEIDHVIYHLGVRDVSTVEVPFVRTNYPNEWIGRYLLKSYLEVDPVAKAGYVLKSPKLWSELDWTAPESRAFQQDASRHGISQSGFLVPMIDKNNRRAMANFSQDLDADLWAKKIDVIKGDLITCANILHSKAVAELFGDNNKSLKLTPRELDCLRLAARGNEASEIGDLLNLSEHTVRDYLKSARLKLGCSNTAQAVHKATLLRLT